MIETYASQLVTIANRLRAEEGADRAAGRLIGVAAVLLLLAGVTPANLNTRLADAIREFDEDDNGARH